MASLSIHEAGKFFFLLSVFASLAFRADCLRLATMKEPQA